MKAWKHLRDTLNNAKPVSKLLWLYALEHGENGEYSTANLADALGVVQKSITNALNELEALGAIEITARGAGKTPRKMRANI